MEVAAAAADLVVALYYNFVVLTDYSDCYRQSLAESRKNCYLLHLRPLIDRPVLVANKPDNRSERNFSNVE
jgi:hypothetical protein